MMRGVFVSLMTLAGIVTTSDALAQHPEPVTSVLIATAPAAVPADPARTPRIRLHHDLLVDTVGTGVLAASLISWGFLKTSIGFKHCTICDGPPGKANAVDDLFRDGLKHDDIGPTATLSHILSYGGGPVMGFALTIGVAAADRRIDEAPLNCLLVIEASLAAVVMKEALTAFVRRERPEVHALEGEAKTKALSEGDPLESFPGGHTTSIMAITASSAVIATLRGYRLAPLIWIVGSTLAAASTYLRIASDQHFFSDNVMGALVGVVVGAGVPLLFHRRIHEPPNATTRFLGGAMLTSSAVPGGRVVGLGWSF